jgi:hypothetical protein
MDLKIGNDEVGSSILPTAPLNTDFPMKPFSDFEVWIFGYVIKYVTLRPRGHKSRALSRPWRRMTRTAQSRHPAPTSDAALRPVIGAIRSSRSILSAQSSVCGLYRRWRGWLQRPLWFAKFTVGGYQRSRVFVHLRKF